MQMPQKTIERPLVQSILTITFRHFSTLSIGASAREGTMGLIGRCQSGLRRAVCLGLLQILAIAGAWATQKVDGPCTPIDFWIVSVRHKMKIIGLPLAGVKKVGKAVTPQRTRMYYYLWVSGLDPKICYVDFKPSTQTLPAMVPATVGTAAQNGTAAALIVSADLNGDGILDEIVSNLDTEIDISLGNEDGSLQSPVSYDLRTEVSSIAVADVNGDGKPDVIVTGFGDTTSYVSVLLGNGDGTLQAPVNLSVGTFPQSVAIGDFNGDGKPDLAVAADDALYLLLGNGNGTFHAPVSLLSGTGLSVIAADFNGDGKLDLALGQFAQASGKGTVAVLMGNGNGTF